MTRINTEKEKEKKNPKKNKQTISRHFESQERQQCIALDPWRSKQSQSGVFTH
jgi:hypothetical protein